VGVDRTHLPPRRLGRPRKTDLRAVLNALLDIGASGCQWRLLPDGFPPDSTVQRFFYAWRQTAPGSGSTTPL